MKKSFLTLGALLLAFGSLYAAPPTVKTVPWVASDPLIPHDTWSGKLITLKGTSDSQTGGGSTYDYSWDFGDGSPVATGSVNNKYAIQATHAYTGADGTIFTARLTVRNATTGETGSKPYYVRIEPKTLPVEVNVAIDEALWYLHKDMRRFSSGGLDMGDWTAGQAGGFASSSYYAATFLNINAFEVNGHLQNGAPENPYVETVQRGLRRIFEMVTTIPVPLNPANHGLAAARGANPDASTPPNGLGIQVNQSHPWYQGGMAMDAIIASGTPNAIAPTGSAGIVGRTYAEIVQDMVDAYAWAQYDFSGGGGWRYAANQFPDNSACQWAAIGLLPAERNWGLIVPQWLKDWNMAWLDYSKGSGANLGTFGYLGTNWFAAGPYATTPSGMVQLAMNGVGRGNPLWDNAETYLRDRFGNTGDAGSSIKGNYYGMFSFTKSLLLHDSNNNGIPDDGLGNEPGHIVLLKSQTAGVAPLDWYGAETTKGDPTNGVARTLVNEQNVAGYWNGHYNVSADQGRLETAEAIIMLNQTVFEAGLTAVANANSNPAVAGQTISLDGSDSFHQDPLRKIVGWDWDLDNNGTFDVSGPFANVSFPALGDYPVKLRVTDDGTPVKTAQTFVTIRVTIPPLAPTADAGGPYVFCPGVAKWFLDAARSSNPDDGLSEPGKPVNRIIEYAWEFDGDNDFDDAVGPTPDVSAYFRSLPMGSYLIQLRVSDNTATSFPSSGQPNLTSVDSAVVVVEAACNCVNNLTARAKGTKIQLTWSNVAADHYNIYRGPVSGGPYTRLATTYSTYCTWLDNKVVSGTTYYYVVRPADALDRELCQSNEASAKPSPRAGPTTNNPPTAHAGGGQSGPVGRLITLDGSRSSDLDGDPLSFKWSFTSRPIGSTATLSSTSAVRPSFTIDKPGNYVIQLMVNDGKVDSLPNSVTISTLNTPPSAIAGPNQSVVVGLLVSLNGSGSNDVDGDPLTYAWSFTTRPSGSTALLSASTAVSPTFTVDKAGTYEIKLIVNDGKADSAPALVTISTVNSAPVSNAGPNQTVFLLQTVTLDGSGSSDVDGDPLTYAWSFTSRPAGSLATLSSTTAVKPTFVADVHGNYVLQLVVRDGTLNSVPVGSVIISTTNSPPVADAGTDQSAVVGQLITLDASRSIDVDGDPLTFKWSLTRPTGSTAVLSSTIAVLPTFRLDRPGSYIAQLICNDGTVDGAPDTITVTTLNSAPVADAGPNATFPAPRTITLDGNRSFDVDGDLLNYFWSVVSVPPGSNAGISSNNVVKPTINLDLAGTYVAQLLVDDGKLDSPTTSVTVTTLNSPPVANAGPDQTAALAGTATLDGSKSSDVNGDALTFFWSFASRPPGSGAALSDVNSVTPTFNLDLPGNYVAQLIVNDGIVNSLPHTVRISTVNSKPVADAGPDQSVTPGTIVSLTGVASTDADANPLLYRWAITSRPAGSTAILSSSTEINPTFVADLPGNYVIQLIANDGTVDSAPDTVVASTFNSRPVARASVLLSGAAPFTEGE